MISIIATAVLSTALGQAPPPGPNPLENTINILRADGVSVRGPSRHAFAASHFGGNVSVH